MATAWQIYDYAPSVPSFVVGVLFVAYAQRGMSNLLHDCAHFNLFATTVRFFLLPFPVVSSFFFSQTNNYIVGDLFLSHALMTSVKGYRASHNDHHRHLGKKDDPDHGEGNATSMRHYRVCSFLVTRTSLTGLSGMPLRPHLFTLPLHL